MKRRKRVLAVGISGALALAFAGAILASQLGPRPPDPAVLDAAIEAAPMMQVADIAATGNLPEHGVFVQVTSNGQVCLWDAPTADPTRRQGGCDDASDPLGGARLSASLSYDGGPAAVDVKDARLVGLADPSAARIRVLMSDGSSRPIRLASSRIRGESYRVFGYRFRRSDLRSGLGPVAVVALDAAGAEIGRQSTGFGG